MTSPPLQSFQHKGLHRLIPSKFSAASTVLADIADNEEMLADIVLLDGATNGRIQGEHHGLSGITPYELVYGVPNAHIIRAAFLHPSPFGSRFNDTTRGAWYAALKLETSLAEVTYHRAKHLAEIVVSDLPNQQPGIDLAEYDDWQADFNAAFHSLNPEKKYRDCLQPEPVPQCYAPSQLLARSLLSQGSNGILYPSTRHPGGVCIACFRPPLVYNPRQSERYEISFTLVDGTYKSKVRRVPL